MSKLRVDCFAISLDGYAAGPQQSLQNPLGMGGTDLHTWAFGTRTFQKAVLGADAGTAGGVDDDFAKRSFENVGAWIMGRNMFTPSRGPWPDDNWRGWWGEEPVYHVPVFVLTHHARAPLVMQGGTTFHFITDGIHSALEQAKAAAKGKDVRVGGGAATVRQYLRERLIDEMHLAYAPTFLGSGEKLFEGLDLRALGYASQEVVASPAATHVVITRSD